MFAISPERVLSHLCISCIFADALSEDATKTKTNAGSSAHLTAATPIGHCDPEGSGQTSENKRKTTQTPYHGIPAMGSVVRDWRLHLENRSVVIRLMDTRAKLSLS